MSKFVSIAHARVGPGEPSFVIAEAGVNHNGNLDLAHKMIDVAADAGVDAIKFQTFEPESLAAPTAPKAKYQVENTGEGGSQLEMLRKLVLPRSSYPELMKHAAEKGLIFLSTPFDEASADFLYSLGIAAFKVSSGDLTNHPLLLHIARTGRPMLISTGMASLEGVGAAVSALRSAGMPPLVLFHCVTSYPARAADCNLRAIETLRSRFGVPVGWSDHTEGFDISVAAVALGANAVEKHFTLDRALPGPDHAASLEPGELVAMVKAIRRVESALGTGVKQAAECEIAVAPVAYRSLFWNRDLRTGMTVTAEDLIALRPGTGISPSKLPLYLGRQVTREVQKGEILKEADLLGASE
jgi:N,N'-diacetyllegionaminate synthase